MSLSHPKIRTNFTLHPEKEGSTYVISSSGIISMYQDSTIKPTSAERTINEIK